MNITDIDDKIILRAREQNIDPFKLAKKWENAFFKDMDSLGVKSPDCVVRVSEHIPEIIHYIERIMNNGFGYLSNGSVYFDIENFKKSGKIYPKLDPGAASDPQRVFLFH